MFATDCQVMYPAGNLNMVCSSSPETLFPSSPAQSPNFNFMSHLSFPTAIIPKEEVSVGGNIESGSGSEHMEEENQADLSYDDSNNKKKKHYHRHSGRQIREMEAMFKVCPHPDDKQRMRLSQDLGLKPRQVKFWFQNRRTQLKAQQDRTQNVMLRAENESLKNENYRLQVALRNISCPTCGGPAILGEISLEEQHLRLENARLKEELERVCILTNQHTASRTMHSSPPLLHPSLELDINMYNSRPFHTPMSQNCTDIIPIPENPNFISVDHTSADFLLMDDEKPIAIQLTHASMEELVSICKAGAPLWIPSGETEILNLEEYAKMFPWPINLKSNHDEMRVEATRGKTVVIMNSITLVDAFMNAEKWVELFPSIVSRARTIQVVYSGTISASGSLHLMYAELQVLSPLVPTRAIYFLRFCHQNVEDGTWVIVDCPIDNFRGNNVQSIFPNVRRHPSGCIVRDQANGYSSITWLEHVEVLENPIHHIFDQLVSSGVAFGAKRWLTVLERQCERMASLMATNVSDGGVIDSLDARKNMMRLSQRMVRAFCIDISCSNNQSWMAISDSWDDTVRITTRKATDPGQPNGVILSAVSTTWLPYDYINVFDFLRDEGRRSQLDVLSNGNSLHEVSHIANGSHPGNSISLLRVNVASNSSQNVELVLQESCTDDSGSLIVYSTMGVDAVQLAMSCRDPSYISLLPQGFIITPNPRQPGSPHDSSTKTAMGCLLTVGLQALASPDITSKLNLVSVTAINSHLSHTVQQITRALSGIMGERGEGSR